MQEIVFDTQDLLSDNGIEKETVCKLTPWESSSYELINWWDMEQFSASKFYNIVVLLERIKQNYSKKILNIAPIDEDVRLELERLLRPIEQECQKLTLRNSVGTINEFRTLLLNWKIEAFSNITPNQVAMRIDEIDRAIKREMKLHLFMFISGEKAEYYQSWGEKKREEREEEIPLFGNAVKTKFPSVSYDVIEAGNSFATDRYTACVFHLMRILEIGLTVLANRFDVSAEHSNWNPIIDQIEAKIRDLKKEEKKPTNWKEEEEFYHQVASHFRVLKDAWRNYTIHVRGKYTEEEAKILIINVRAFMQKLSTKLSE